MTVLHECSTIAEITDLIDRLNRNAAVHGILVQSPLDICMDNDRFVELVAKISPVKDVDGLCHENMAGLLLQREKYSSTDLLMRPCTPTGILRLLDFYGLRERISGSRVLMVGKSEIVGLPAALMLMKEDATVTICHSKSRNLNVLVGEAEILIVAIGKSKFIKGEWIKKDSIVIDVGINREPDGILSGDVDFETASQRAFAITPVPGGVGPMTVAILAENLFKSAKRQFGLS